MFKSRLGKCSNNLWETTAPVDMPRTHLGGSVQSARTWSVAKQLKHFPTRSRGTGRRGEAAEAAARRQRLRLCTGLKPFASGSTDMRTGCTTTDASRAGSCWGGRGSRWRAASVGADGEAAPRPSHARRRAAQSPPGRPPSRRNADGPSPPARRRTAQRPGLETLFA